MSRAVHAPSTLGKIHHQKTRPMFTHRSGEEDIHRGRRRISETITFPEVSECELLLEELGFCSAWVPSALWRKSKDEETPSPEGCRPSWDGVAVAASPWLGALRWAPGGREAVPLHHRDTPGEGTHHPLLQLGAEGWGQGTAPALLSERAGPALLAPLLASCLPWPS